MSCDWWLLRSAPPRSTGGALSAQDTRRAMLSARRHSHNPLVSVFSFSFCLNINAFQSPLVQQQDPHDMSALQPWLKFNAMAYHKTEKLTYQILFYFSFCISSSFSASLLSRPSIHPVSPALFPLHFFLVRPFLRVAAPMRTMNDCRASRACVSMGGNQ